jgi:hypothetical protein
MSELYRPDGADDDFVVVYTRGDEVVGVSFGEKVLPFEQHEVTTTAGAQWRETYEVDGAQSLVGVELED